MNVAEFVIKILLYQIYVYIVNQSKGRIYGIHAAEFVIKINPVTIFDQ
jgi:hypothetical protein